MKLIILILLCVINFAQSNIFQSKPGYYGKYLLKIEVISRPNDNLDFSADLFFSKQEDEVVHYNLRWKNEKIKHSGQFLDFTPKLRSIHQPIRVEFDEFDLISIDHNAIKYLWRHMFPFNLDKYQEKIKQGETFNKEIPGNFVFPYSVEVFEEFYELKTFVNETEWFDPGFEVLFPPIFDVSCHQLIQRDNFGLKEFEFQFKIEKNFTVKSFMNFIGFVKTEDF